MFSKLFKKFLLTPFPLYPSTFPLLDLSLLSRPTIPPAIPCYHSLRIPSSSNKIILFSLNQCIRFLTKITPSHNTTNYLLNNYSFIRAEVFLYRITHYITFASSHIIPFLLSDFVLFNLTEKSMKRRMFLFSESFKCI